MYSYTLEKYKDQYKDEINTKYLPVIKIEEIELNKNGFADILSIDLNCTIKLKKAKNRINEYNNTIWEKIKKITNPYEYIYAFNINHKDNDANSVSDIKPLSRSFFKMIEIINEFCKDIIIDNKQPIITAHIAEGPGGFIEATRYIRNGLNKNECKYVTNDLAYGITLVDDGLHKNIPSWKQSGKFLNDHPEIYISKGEDGTGNLYNVNNIKTFINTIKNGYNKGKNDNNDNNNDSGYDNYKSKKAILVTADGGFDFSIDYNYQEQASAKLIFAQILTALGCQEQHGTFVCKFFETNTYFITEMLYLLSICYEIVTIYKPFTSRIANSEKYIICRNFKNIDIIFYNSLLDILVKWNNLEHKHYTINYIFEEIPQYFINNIKDINTIIVTGQIKSINNAIDVIKNKKQLNNHEWYNQNLQKQIENAIEWCKKYNIPYKNNYPFITTLKNS